MKKDELNENLTTVKTKVYDKLSLDISHLKNELEGREYDACQFVLNGSKIICRSSKTTPKKVGQFVTFWRRDGNGITEPFDEQDDIDFYVINSKSEGRMGQFVFPKSALRTHGILTSKGKGGKRGFRVYPAWDEAQNKQAQKTQSWQLKYFYEIGESINFEKVLQLYDHSAT